MSIARARLIFSVAVICSSVLAFSKTENAKLKARPLFKFSVSAKDSHAIELNDWAARNNLHEAAAPDGRKRLRLIVIGCNAIGAECFFVHEGDARTSVFEPRLRGDWAVTLKQELAPGKIREMSCVSSLSTAADGSLKFSAEGASGECSITFSERTREEVRRSSPAVARVIGSARGPSATINLIRKKR